MTLFEFVPFVIAVFLAFCISIFMYYEYGWQGLIIGGVIGLVIVIIGLGLGIYIASRNWPKMKKLKKENRD